MGKAKIIASEGQGQYRIAEILRNADGTEKEGPEIVVWCADYTEDLAEGEIVGTIEVGGTGQEYKDGDRVRIYLIRPGYQDPEEEETSGAVWNADHGVMAPQSETSPSGFFYNAAILPVWQRHAPTFRSGVISNIDHEEHRATVCLRPAVDNWHGLPLEPTSLPECTIEDEAPPGDFHLEQVEDFCSRNPSHPLCQDVPARTSVSYDQMWDTIVAINTLVNTQIRYVFEPVDRWDVIALPGVGDCEDYALTKMHRLAQAGVPASAMGLAIGKIGSGPSRGTIDVDHAWAVVFTDKGIFHLDQAPNIPQGRQPGSGFQILRHNTLEVLSRRLDNVPIKYMDCDSEAFEEGDDVIVHFKDRIWTSPEVIGFREEPQQCTGYLWLRMRNFVVVWDLRADAPATDSLTGIELGDWPVTFGSIKYLDVLEMWDSLGEEKEVGEEAFTLAADTNEWGIVTLPLENSFADLYRVYLGASALNPGVLGSASMSEPSSITGDILHRHRTVTMTGTTHNSAVSASGSHDSRRALYAKGLTFRGKSVGICALEDTIMSMEQAALYTNVCVSAALEHETQWSTQFKHSAFGEIGPAFEAVQVYSKEGCGGQNPAISEVYGKRCDDTIFIPASNGVTFAAIGAAMFRRRRYVQGATDHEWVIMIVAQGGKVRGGALQEDGFPMGFDPWETKRQENLEEFVAEHLQPAEGTLNNLLEFSDEENTDGDPWTYGKYLVEVKVK